MYEFTQKESFFEQGSDVQCECRGDEEKTLTWTGQLDNLAWAGYRTVSQLYEYLFLRAKNLQNLVFQFFNLKNFVKFWKEFSFLITGRKLSRPKNAEIVVFHGDEDDGDATGRGRRNENCECPYSGPVKSVEQRQRPSIKKSSSGPFSANGQRQSVTNPEVPPPSEKTGEKSSRASEIREKTASKDSKILPPEKSKTLAVKKSTAKTQSQSKAFPAGVEPGREPRKSDPISDTSDVR